MDTLVIDRKTCSDTIFSFIGAERAKLSKQQGGAVIMSPIFDNDTEYLNSIPGMAESLIKEYNAPESECEDAPEDWFA